MGLIVRPDSPITNVADLVAAAKQKPGALNYGHPGVSTIPQLAMEELQQTAGIDIKDIPFRTGPLLDSAADQATSSNSGSTRAGGAASTPAGSASRG